MSDSIFRKNITANTNEVLLPVNANMTEDSYNYSYNRLEEQVIFFGYSSLDQLNEAAFYILYDLDLYVNDKILRLSVMEKLYDLLINSNRQIPKQINKEHLITLFTSKYIGSLLELARYRASVGLADTDDTTFKQPYLQFKTNILYVIITVMQDRFDKLDKYIEQL